MHHVTGHMGGWYASYWNVFLWYKFVEYAIELLAAEGDHLMSPESHIYFHRNQRSLLTSNLSSIGLVMCLGNLRRGGLNTGDKGDCFSPSENTNTTSVNQLSAKGLFKPCEILSENDMSFTYTGSCLWRVKRCKGNCSLWPNFLILLLRIQACH